ncbi:flavodoxin family protein [Micromonospora sp. DT81.3]|uniref:flavodoxin family protein n=1 Tax=Micromonospora sp. DT81.3 TaxID=3416523 RepID=UPI003CEB1F8D
MRAVVVYESLFGNTHEVASAIGDGVAEVMAVTVLSVSDATPALVEGVDLVVVGGPTHVHGMSLAPTRDQAQKMAADSGGELHLDENASGIGVREWLERLPASDAMAAAFDTRINVPRVLSGAASGRIDHALRRRGLRAVSTPMSFLVNTSNQLESSELARARAWGIDVAHDAMSTDAADTTAARR